MKTTNWLLALLACGTLACLSTRAATLFVWQDSPSPGPAYGDWASAAHTIQDALDVASEGDTVLVTNGVYASGGRGTWTETIDRVQVNGAVTVRSVNGPAATIIVGAEGTSGGNSDGATRCVSLLDGAVLSGFTLTNGYTTSYDNVERERCGGGIWCSSTNVLVTNCVLSGNAARNEGGGAYRGTLVNCILTGNAATYGGGVAGGTLKNCILTGNVAYGWGGGALESALSTCALTGNSAPTGGGASCGLLDNCILTGNWASDSGGGASCGTLSNCTLIGNSATNSGGGVGCGTLLNNCTLTGNWAKSAGGAYWSTVNNCALTSNSATIYGGGAARSTLNNCALNGNSAQQGGGAAGGTLNNCTLTGNSAQYGGGVAAEESGPSTLNNCIVYFNIALDRPNYDSESTLNYCCTTPLPPYGVGNITSDPQLADFSHLSANSPCRGAGSSAYDTGTDIDGEPWADPPSIGCDEYWPSGATGPCSVVITAAYTNVAPLFTVSFAALIPELLT